MGEGARARAGLAQLLALRRAPRPRRRAQPGQRLQAGALRKLKHRFQLDNLLLFNRKFAPVWERRYVVYERRLDLPRVGVAALAAESYLPFQ